MSNEARFKPYEQPAGGWGSAKSLAKHSRRQKAISSFASLARDHNKTGG